MSATAARPRLLLRERAIILLAVAGVTAISWLYLLAADRAMPGMSGMAMPMPAAWTPARFGITFAMWAVMMVGMMLPSAAPMILTFATLDRRKRAATGFAVPTFLFTLGYLVVWTAFSFAATLLQCGLDRLALLSPMLGVTSALVGGLVFLLAGVYQLTPVKQACLRHCRSPFAFVLNHWHDGGRGALRMGAEHGAYCLGCCWMLMALMFVVGVMNLLWMAALALFVFVEKLLPGGLWIARISGLAMGGYGVWLLVQA